MEGNMKVAIMTDVMKMDFTERPIPQPKDDEVLTCRCVWFRSSLF